MASKHINVLMSLVDKFTGPMKRVQASVAMTEKELKRAQNAAAHMSRSMTSSFAAAAKQAVAFGATIATAAAAVGAGIVQQYAEHEKTMAGLSFLLGEQQAKDLDKFAAVIGKTTDLSRKGALDIAKSWAASGASLDVAKANIKILTDMAAAGSMTEEQIGLVNTQLIQMFGRGYAERGDLKAISNSLPGVFNYLKDYLHVTQEELDDMIKNHQVTADQTMKAIQAKTRGAADAVGNTLVSKFNNLKDTVQNISTALGGALAKSLNVGGGMDFLSNMLDKVEDFATKLQAAIESGMDPLTALRQEVQKAFGGQALSVLDAVVEGVRALITAIVWLKNVVVNIIAFVEAHPVLSQILISIPAVIAGTVLIVGAIARIKTAIMAVTVAFKVLTAIMAANPIVLAIMAVIAVLMLLYFNWDRIVAFFNETIASIREWFINAWNNIKATVQGVWDSIVQSFTSCIDRIKGLWEGFKSAISSPIDTVIRARKEQNAAGQNATGTSYFPGGWTHVNEGGRGELINLPSGSQIIPNSLSKAALARGGNQNINITVNVSGNVIGNDDFYNECGRVITERLTLALGNM